MKKTLYLIVIIIINMSFANSLKAQWVKILDEKQSERVLLDIYFLKDNPDYGWICGKDARLLRTTDRGENWEEYVIDPSKPGGIGFFESVVFLNPNVGYVSGPGGVYKSTNGGKNWTLVLDERLWGCYFVDENYGMAVGNGCSFGGQDFYRTTNGGVTWEYQGYSDVSTSLTDVYLESKDGNGLAVSSGFLWKTTDGGRNWKIRNNTGNVDWQEELSFKGNTFILPYSKGCSGGNGGGGVRFSTDGGYTYRDSDLGAAMFGTFVISDSVGWVCGWKNTMKKTTDAGRTWTQYDCGLNVKDDMDDIYFIDDTTGFVVGMGIYKYKLPGTYFSKINLVDSSACDGDPVLLEAEGDYAFYEWNGVIGDKFLEVEKSGKYILKAYNMSCDTIISDTIDVNVNTSVGVDIDYSNPFLCEGDSAYIAFDSSNLDSYSWSDGFIGTERYFVSDTTVVLQGIDINKCDFYQEFKFKFDPLAKVSYSDYVKVICKDNPVYLEANVEGASDFIWYKDGKPISSNQKRIQVDSGSQYYIVTKNNLGCASVSDSISINYQTINDQISVNPLSGEENVDLGEMKVASPLSFSIAVHNNSKADYLLEEAHMEMNSCFSIPKAQLPVLIPAESSVNLDVNFFCADYGELKDKLVLRDRCTYDSIEVEIFRLHNSFEVESKCEVPLTVTNVKMRNPRLTQARAHSGSGKISAEVNYISDKEENAEISLFNTLGDKIATLPAQQYEINSSEGLSTFNITAEISDQNLMSGFYFISVNVGGVVTNLKVTISK